MIDIFLDPLIIPVYYYVLGYLAVFIIAVIIARLVSDEGSLGSYESATHIGWLIGFSTHLLAGIILDIYFGVYRAIEESASWSTIALYVTIYLLVIIVDVVFMIALIQRLARGKKRKKAR